jgi:ADP-ribosylglycohydrolase
MSAGREDRFVGCLLGLAVGDALGTTLEFKAPGRFEPINDIVGGGPFGLQAGQWTDDTSMALCLGQSLLDCRGHDPRDQMARYVQWWKNGYFSSTGVCFDIGMTIRGALGRFLRDGNPIAGSEHPDSAGNGSLMRLAPAAMYYASDPIVAAQMAGASSVTTHGATAAVDACRCFGAMLASALGGASRGELMGSEALSKLDEPLCPEIAQIAGGSFRDKEPPEIKGTGYVVQSLEAALWAFNRSKSFEEGALLAVNLGDDADTTGAIYGQIAGAYFGASGIPASWRGKVSMRGAIEAMAIELMEANGWSDPK